MARADTKLLERSTNTRCPATPIFCLPRIQSRLRDAPTLPKPRFMTLIPNMFIFSNMCIFCKKLAHNMLCKMLLHFLLLLASTLMARTHSAAKMCNSRASDARIRRNEERSAPEHARRFVHTTRLDACVLRATRVHEVASGLAEAYRGIKPRSKRNRNTCRIR